MTSLRALRRPGMSLRSALALHVNMTAALSPWMFRFELGALHQRSVANTSKMLWRRRGFNSQVEKQLIKTRRTYRKRKICTIFIIFCHAGNWIWFVRRQPQQQGHCFVKPRGRVWHTASRTIHTICLQMRFGTWWCKPVSSYGYKIMFLSARTWFKFGT